MDNGDDGFLAAVIAVVVAATVGSAIGHGCGFDSGVRANAAGTHVVVQLPDGTLKVCEVKPLPPKTPEPKP